jgi:hypothetical protein
MSIVQFKEIILFVCGFFNLFLAFVLWLRGKSKITLHLGWVALFSALYSFTYGISYFCENKLFWSRATWLGVFILPAYLTFLYYFTGRTKYLKLKSSLWYLGAVVISYLALATPYIIEEVGSEYPYLEKEGPLEFLGRLYIIVCLILGFFHLLKEYSRVQGLRKLQLKYFILGAVIYAGSGIIFAGILPLISLKFIQYVDLSAISSVFWVGLTTYAIFKKELFEIRIILTEILVGLMGLLWIIFIFLMPAPQLKGLALVSFLLFLIFGYLLIRSAYQEIRKRKEAERFKNTSLKLKEKMSEILDLKEIVSQIMETLMETFQTDKISLALKQMTSEFYQFRKTVGFSEKELSSLIRDTNLCSLLEKSQKPSTKEELKEIEYFLEKNEIFLLLPLFLKQKLTGIIFFGEKKSKKPYVSSHLTK